MDLSEFEARLVYKASSRTAGATEKLCLEKQRQKKKKTLQNYGKGFVVAKPWGSGPPKVTDPPPPRQQKGPRSDSSKSNKIFVGGIPHNCGETELREYFKKFGVVSSVRCSGHPGHLPCHAPTLTSPHQCCPGQWGASCG